MLTVIAVGQIVLAIILYERHANILIRNIGWGILWLSAVFGWVPILTLKRWGGVAKGKSYVHTTQIVEKGVYAIVRHPQYLAGILMAVALVLIAQHWIVGIFGVAAVVIYYGDTSDEEKRCLGKFGEAYSRYAERVPRLNFLLGTVRALKRRAAD